MPPDEPDSQHGISKRHRRCRSHSMTDQVTVVDLTGEGGSSRKHGLHEKDTQVEGPSKRPKVKRDSEPPMRKDTTLAPKAKRKKSRKKVNHHKASRTSNHHQLKDRVKLLECVRDSATEAHDDEIKELQADLDWHRTELKKLAQLYKEQTGEVREQKQMVETERRDIQALKRKLEDAVDDFEASKLSCQNKDEDLKEKEKVIALQREELDESKHRSKSLEKILAETKLTVKRKDEVIKALQEELEDCKRQITSLEQSLAEMKLALEGKNSTIDAMQKELDGIKQQYASLKESLVETQDALKTAKRVQSDWREKLLSNEDELSSTKRELNETKQDLEKTTRKADALHLINDENGYWNFKITQGEKTAQNQLKSERAENKTNAQKLDQEKSELRGRCETLEADLEAQENERNQAVGSLQSKLNASRQRYNYKEPDEKVKTDFTNLESKIRQFVDKYARPVLNATDQELKTVWPEWSPGLRSFLASPLLCNQVLEAYVWSRLISRVFKQGSQVWAGDLGESLEKTLHMAYGEVCQAGFKSDDYIDFQYMRSSSSSLISRLNGAVFLPKYFDSDVDTMISTLAKLGGLSGANSEMKADAMDIFKDARRFEIQLRLLKAVYTFRVCKFVPPAGKRKYGFFFADEEMDDRSLNRGGKSPGKARMVDFIMCPGLYKRGNSDGAHYEAKTCLIKMGVVCNTKEILQKSGSSNSAKSASTRNPKALRSSEVKQENGGSTPRYLPTSTANQAKKGSSVTNPLHIKGDETDLPQDPDTMSTPGLAFGSRATEAHDADQLQPGMKTRSRGQPKTNNNVNDGKPNTKSTKNHPHPMGTPKGRGGGSSGKKVKNSKQSDPDADWNAGSTI